MRKKPLLAVALVIAAIVLIALLRRDDQAPPNTAPAAPAVAVDSAPASSADSARAAREAPRDAARVAAPAAAAGAPSEAEQPEAVAPSETEQPEAIELWGRVSEVGTAAPIANADVELQHRDADEFRNLDPQYGERITSVARTSSDGAGRFRFGVERARRYQLVVRAAGYAPVVVPRCTGGAEQIVELSHGATVDGVVRCEGEPVAGAEVRIGVRDERIELARGRTDGDGAFRFTGLPAARAFVHVGTAACAEKWKELEIAAGKEHHVEIELDRGETLRGRVVDAATSAPIAGAEVSESLAFARVVRTDAEGRFALAGLRDFMRVMCHARARGYALAARNVGGRLAEEAELRLVRGAEVVGRIVDPVGAPIAAVYVAVCAKIDEAGGVFGPDWIPCTMGTDARFQAIGLRPGQHYWLMARGAGLGSRVYALPRVLGSGERLDVGDVVMRAPGAIEGRVVDDAGVGVADQGITMRGTNADSRTWLGPGATAEDVAQFTHWDAQTDRSGVFRVRGLAAGKYEVWLQRNVMISATADVKDGALCKGIEFVVPSVLTIAGTIAYANGKAVADELAGASLEASLTTGRRYAAHARGGGSFRFDGLADGEYTIAASSLPKGWALAPVARVRAGTTNVQLVLEPAAIISGRVVDSAGNAEKARVWAVHGGGGDSQATDDEGRFRLEVAPNFSGILGAFALQDPGRHGHLEGVLAGQSDVVITLSAVSHSARHR